MDRYRLISQIGEGTYGVVYKANDLHSGNTVALKYIRLEIDDKSGGIPSTALREISILGQLDHPNIIKLHDVFLLQKKCILSFEYVSHDLKALLDAMAPTPLDPFTIKSFIFQLLQGVAYCHRNFIMHRDLKPQNLLVTDDGILKVADFGLARPFSPILSKYSADVVTLWYRAPELLLGQEDYDCSVDIWSVGCIMCELLNNTPPFTGSSEYSQLKAIFSLLGTPDDDIEEDDNNNHNNNGGGDNNLIDDGTNNGQNNILNDTTAVKTTSTTSATNTTNATNMKNTTTTAITPTTTKTMTAAVETTVPAIPPPITRPHDSSHTLPGYKAFLRHHSKTFAGREHSQIITRDGTLNSPPLPLPFPTHAGDVIMKPTPWQQICPRLQGPGLDLLHKMLTLNPHHRISANDALTHPFFADLAVVEATE